jgi:acetylornithine deacetylase/succinyl-diaminopimelate desuccinylase-like protein
MKTFLGTILTMFVASGAVAAPSAATHARQWRTAHEQQILDELRALLSIPNVAADAPNIERNAQALLEMFRRRGIEARLLRAGSAPPLVVADVKVPHATRTIGWYAHYDGQPVDETRWKTPPWTPTFQDGRVYARSASDDKGAIVAMFAALDANRAAGIAPGANLKFVFEGEEEAGSPHLERLFADHAADLRVDAWLMCDGPVHQSRRMQLLFGARGTTDLELTVYGPVRPLHSGHYGNWAPNPLVSLTRLLASMRDDEGRILIDGFYEQVRPVTAAEKEAIAKLPPVDAALRQELHLGRTEGHGASLYESIMLPALNLRGIAGGRVGEAASNTIHTEASASIDFRLVPDQTPDALIELVERHVRAQGFTIVRETPDAAARGAARRLVKMTWQRGYPALKTRMDLPLSRDVIAIASAATGGEVIAQPLIGGTLPMHIFAGPRKVPVIVVPIANHDNNQHAENENLRLQNLWDGIEVYAALMADLR